VRKKTSNTPPYVPRKGLHAVLDFAQRLKTGDQLLREDLHKRGVSAHWTYPALASLRFLGLLDASDHLTGLHIAYDPENPDKSAQKTIIRKAYHEFFSQVDIPLSNLQSARERFMKIYDLSERVTNSAFPIFAYLTEEAGIQLVDSERKGTESKPELRPDIIDEDKVVSSSTNLEYPVQIRHLGYQVVINLQVTKFTSEKDLMKMIRTANRAVHLMKKAGDKYG